MGEARGEESSDPLCGVVLDGRYRVAEVIGVGGMGVVYRAEQVSAHGRDVAVKVLSSHALGTSTVTLRFETEARIIAQLRHPNTLKMIDSGRFSDGRLYIVTEFLSGVPLSEIIRGLPYDVMRTVRIMRQVCDSLSEAHGLGIVHRDLKPSNIFVETVAGQEIVKVLDFGLAKLLEVPGLTLPMRICGTPGFMAPEQICGQPIDARADIYSLGAILYECLSGRAPFVNSDLNRLLMMHVTEVPRALTELLLPRPVEPELEALVLQMLAKEPHGRPESVMRVREALDRLELRVISNDRDVHPVFPDATHVDRHDRNDRHIEDVDTSPSQAVFHPLRGMPEDSTPIAEVASYDLATPLTPQSPLSPPSPLSAPSPLSPMALMMIPYESEAVREPTHHSLVRSRDETAPPSDLLDGETETSRRRPAARQSGIDDVQTEPGLKGMTQLPDDLKETLPMPFNVPLAALSAADGSAPTPASSAPTEIEIEDVRHEDSLPDVAAARDPAASLPGAGLQSRIRPIDAASALRRPASLPQAPQLPLPDTRRVSIQPGLLSSQKLKRRRARRGRLWVAATIGTVLAIAVAVAAVWAAWFR